MSPRHDEPIAPATIQATRIALQMTLKQLAAILRVNATTIHEWENGSTTGKVPRGDRLKRLHQIVELAPHLTARRAKPDWTL